MIRTIHLHGDMGRRFGRHHRLDVGSAAEAFRALGAQLPGFKRYALEASFRIVRGASLKKGRDLAEGALGMRLGAADLHLVPVVAGSAGGKGQNIGKIVAGTAIAAVAWWAAPAAGGMAATLFGGVTYGNVAGFGLLTALSGVSGLLTPQPKKQKDQSSALFSSAANIAEEGATIPWVWGRCMVGSVVASQGMSAEDIPVNS